MTYFTLHFFFSEKKEENEKKWGHMLHSKK